MRPARTPACLLIVLVSLVIAADAFSAAPRFRPPIHYELPDAGVGAILASDVNRDGRADLILGSPWMPVETTLRLAGPRGRFYPARSVHLAAGGEYVRGGDLAVGDLNGDGDRDIVRVVLERKPGTPYETTLVVLFGDGRGGFPTSTIRRTRGGCCAGHDPLVADFNRDGHNDVAVSDFGIFLGDGTGRFAVRRTALGVSSSGENIFTADFDRDRNLDLVVLNSDEDPDPAGLLFGLGHARFDDAVPLGAGDVASVAIGRFNPDRWPDVATVSYDNDHPPADDVRVLLGTRSGRPRLVTRYRMGTRLREIEVADVNGDRHRDLVVTGYFDSGGLRVLLGNGRGSFRRPLRVTRCCSGWGLLEVGDFNGDRRPDIATTPEEGQGGDRFSTFLNDTPRR